MRRGTANHFENSEWCSEASRYKASRSVHLTDFELGRRISNHMMNFIMISVVRKFYANFLCLWHVMKYHNRPQNTIVSKGNSPFWFNVYSTFFSNSDDPIVFFSGLQPFCHSFAREHKKVAISQESK